MRQDSPDFEQHSNKEDLVPGISSKFVVGWK